MALKVRDEIIQAPWGGSTTTFGSSRSRTPLRSADGRGLGTEARTDASKVRLREVLLPRTTTIDYVYDFGDCWQHRVTVTDVRAGDPELRRLLPGKLANFPCRFIESTVVPANDLRSEHVVSFLLKRKLAALLPYERQRPNAPLETCAEGG